MADGAFRGASLEQDVRFKDKHKKLMASIKFPAVYEKKVKMSKVNKEVIHGWITKRISELLGTEDEVVVNLVFEQLDAAEPNPKEMHINMTGFLEKHTITFMTELWELLLSAQDSIGGIPQVFLEEKKRQLREDKEKQEQVYKAIAEREARFKEQPAEEEGSSRGKSRIDSESRPDIRERRSGRHEYEREYRDRDYDRRDRDRRRDDDNGRRDRDDSKPYRDSRDHYSSSSSRRYRDDYHSRHRDSYRDSRDGGRYGGPRDRSRSRERDYDDRRSMKKRSGYDDDSYDNHRSSGGRRRDDRDRNLSRSHDWRRRDHSRSPPRQGRYEKSSRKRRDHSPEGSSEDRRVRKEDSRRRRETKSVSPSSNKGIPDVASEDLSEDEKRAKHEDRVRRESKRKSPSRSSSTDGDKRRRNSSSSRSPSPEADEKRGDDGSEKGDTRGSRSDDESPPRKRVKDDDVSVASSV